MQIDAAVCSDALEVLIVIAKSNVSDSEYTYIILN